MNPTEKNIMTPNEAAAVVGCGRSSIMRAIRSGGLPATRDNHNAWTLRREDVERWAGRRPITDRPIGEQATGHGPDMATQVEVAVLRVRLEAAEARAAELERERDRWHVLATTPQPNFLDRLLGQFKRERVPSAADARA